MTIKKNEFMKQICLVTICLLGFSQLKAQLQITSGAEIVMTGNALLTLQDVDLVNNGIFNQSAGTVRFSGSANSSISGSQATRFYNIELAKNTSNQVTLLRHINTDNQISFTGGHIDLNGFNIFMSPTALLVGENENSRIKGIAGGYVEISNTLTNPSGINPGNLGAMFTTGANMGNTRIRRGHQSQINGYGNGNSILRYYGIDPANNTGLAATLRLYYFDAELNGLPENALTLWKSTNLSNWDNQGFSSRNTTTNYVEKTGIPDFSRWTLSSPGNPLPVKFVLFNVKCSGGSVMLNWKTAFEQNSDHFEVQRSIDGLNWSSIGSIPAAGYSTVEKDYLFVDLNPVSTMAFYRIAEVDVSGRMQYTGIIRNNCAQPEDLQWWPNPVLTQLYVTIQAAQRSTAIINIYNAEGALAGTKQQLLLTGKNQFSVDMRHLASGTYFLTITHNEGKMQTIQVVKN
jgi:hypothetical protein